MLRRAFLLCLAWLPSLVHAQEDTDWIAYRDAYRQMIWFEKYGKPKQFLQSHFRLRPRNKSVAMEGLRLTLSSKTAQVSLTLDALGRAVLPFSKAAYDDNAELLINRKPGQLTAGPWVSIVTRPDGVYAAADLRAACEQLLAYLRFGGEASGKNCVGVQFSYLKTDAVQVQFRASSGTVNALTAKEGPAFAGDVMQGFRVFVYRFAALPEAGQVVTSATPLAIAALLE
ncbi:hypothetical protein SAMN05216319_4413 [Duganella sp. CF402]|uniref:hypothetical protein n=1 Tax=unclassified Duganella TaxID=2636909 RepID=UPI0008C4CC27|nr:MULTISPECIES: hypothetical protein [unclassified Duganella]RZT03809.1 hypothetical protein EV582_4689 [Duganella sp. BK701]SEM58848.1 hypothetical protein SAMN05216319_4413 [Duganella sp. CF402]